MGAWTVILQLICKLISNYNFKISIVDYKVYYLHQHYNEVKAESNIAWKYLNKVHDVH